MPSDPARQFIADAMVEVNALAAKAIEGPYPYKVGGRSFFEHDAPPIIKWRFGSIDHDVPAEIGNFTSELQELEIRVWDKGTDEDDSDAKTRKLKNRVLRACRIVAQRLPTAAESPLQIGSWDWNEDANRSHGRSLVGSVTVRLQVPTLESETTVTITATDNTGYSTNPHTGVEEEVC